MNKIIVFILVLLGILILINIFYAPETFSVNESQYILPKMIYGYWHNLETNEIIKSNIKTWYKHVPKGWKIIILNRKNVENYVSKEFMKKYSNLDATRFSDFLRVELLKNNGGLWMDTSIILVNGNFLDKYYDEMHKNKYDVCVYEYKQRTIDPIMPYLENWFIMAPKNSRYIVDLYEEFDKAFNMGFIKYKKDILLASKVNLTNTLTTRPDETYLMQHAIINYLLYSGKKYKMNIKDSQESMFKIQNIVRWNNQRTINYILNNNNWKGFYAIKLIGSMRKHITNPNKYMAKLQSI